MMETKRSSDQKEVITTEFFYGHIFSEHMTR